MVQEVKAVANTLIHELIHSLDRKIEDARFGHGGNSSEGKDDSAPNWIGDLAQQMLQNEALVAEDKPIVEETESIDILKVERYSKDEKEADALLAEATEEVKQELAKQELKKGAN